MQEVIARAYSSNIRMGPAERKTTPKGFHEAIKKHAQAFGANPDIVSWRTGSRHIDVEMKNMHQVKDRIASMRKMIETKKLPFRIMPAFDPWTNYASGLPNTLFRAWAITYSDAASAGLYEWMDNDRPQTRKPIADSESWGEKQKSSFHLDNDLVFAFGTID